MNVDRIWIFENASDDVLSELMQAFDRGDFDRLKQIASTNADIFKPKTSGCSMCQFDIIQTLIDFETLKKSLNEQKKGLV